MSEIKYIKKRRTARATQLQLTKMIDYLNKGLAEGKVQALHGREEAQKKWAELTTELNSFQGAVKTVDQWQVWRDLKSRVSLKAKDLRKAKALTGNKAITQSELLDFEHRVIGIVEAEYVEGNKDCPDSIPEQEHLLEELEHGNDSVLLDTPKVITICPQISQDNCPDTQNSDVIEINSLNSDDHNNDFIDDSLLHCSRNENEDSEADYIVDNCESNNNLKAFTTPSLKKREALHI